MKLNIQLFATNLSVGGAYTQAWQSGNSVGGSSGAYKWRIAVNYISRDVVANTSYIRIRFQETGTWGSYSGMNSTYSRLKISLNNGSSYTQLDYKKTPSFTKGETETKLDVYYTVHHNDDGSSPNIKIQASNETTNTASYAPANKTITSDTITLTAIPRESKLGAISDFIIATSTAIPISITKYVNTFTDNLVVSIGNTTIKTVSGITTGDNLTFTSAEVATMQSLFSGSSTEITFTLSTYNGSTLIGTSVQTANGIDTSRILGLSRYRSETGYKYCINDVLDKTLDDGLQVGGNLYVNGNEVKPDIFSTNEIDTGKVWIDGKKIYRKVYKKTTGLPGIDTNANFSVSDLHIDHCVRLQGWTYSSSFGYIDLYFYNNGNYNYLHLGSGNTTINYRYHWATSELYFVIEYTKTS